LNPLKPDKAAMLLRYIHRPVLYQISTD